MADVKKVVLAYSGGLDTSVILKWLQDQCQCEVVTFTADIGHVSHHPYPRSLSQRIATEVSNPPE